MRGPTPQEVRHYTTLIRAAIGDSFAFAPSAESESTIQVERGMVLPMALAGADEAEMQKCIKPLLRLATGGKVEQVSTIDHVGQTRPYYIGLLIYSWARALSLRRQHMDQSAWETEAAALRKWCEQLEPQVHPSDWPIGGVPASRSVQMTRAAWIMLALRVAGPARGRREWLERTAEFFGRLAASQQPGGSFLRAGPGDDPARTRHHERVLLHAAASYAVESNDALVTAAVMQAADYNARDSKPDADGAEPWGLFAFIWRRNTRDMADAILTTVSSCKLQERGGISSMLLADCLYCLRLV